MNSFNRLHLFSRAHHTYNIQQEKEGGGGSIPPKCYLCSLAWFLKRCLTTATLRSSVAEQVSGGIKKKSNSLPSQPARVTFTSVYNERVLNLMSDTKTWDNVGQSWRRWIRKERRVIVLITNLQTGSVRNIKPFFVLVSGMSFLLFLLEESRVPLCLRGTEFVFLI